MQIKQSLKDQLMLKVIEMIGSEGLLDTTPDYFARGIHDACGQQTLLSVLVARKRISFYRLAIRNFLVCRSGSFFLGK